MTTAQSAPAISIPEHIVTLLQQGGIAWNEQRFDDARELMEQALLAGQKANNAQAILSARHLLANIAFNQCEDAISRSMHEELLAECRAMNYNAGAASSLGNLALVDVVEGKFDDARIKYEEAIRLYEVEGQIDIANGLRQTMEDLVVQRKPISVPRQPRIT